MSRRMSWGVLAAALAVITGGIAGGAVAFAAPGGLAPGLLAPAAPVAVAAADPVAALDRTRPAVSVQNASTTDVAHDDPAGAGETPAAVAGESVDAAAASSAPAVQAVSCPANLTGSTPGAPGTVSAGGVAGTTTADLDAFAAAYNAQRVANCLEPVPLANVRYDACMEARLFWMAEDPSTDTSSAWGHVGSVRSDGVASVGCDGNLAGGMNNAGATFARKWWDSPGHRLSLYVPDHTGSMAGVCIYFAVTHGGVPDEPYAFARAAARWGSC